MTFQETDIFVLVHNEGIFQCRKVFLFDGDYYVRSGRTDKFMQLLASGGTSFKSAKWKSLKNGQKVLIRKGGSLELEISYEGKLP